MSANQHKGMAGTRKTKAGASRRGAKQSPSKASQSASPKPADGASKCPDTPAVVTPTPPIAVKASPSAIARHDPVGAYIADLARYPVLPPEEQIRLAKRYRETGDVNAAYQLVTSNLRLVVKIAHEYRRTAFSLLDLVQEGNIGLMQAVKKFDPYRGVKLTSYASWWIRAYIIRYLMENWRLVKIGTTRVQRRLFFNLRKEKEKLTAMGFDAGPKLLAERLQVSEADVIDMDRRLGKEEVSLDAPISDDSKGVFGDRLPSREQATDEVLAQDELRTILKQKLDQFGATLVDREKLIFEQRLVSEKPLTLQEIGDKYGISRERARQIEANVTRRLKTFLEAELPDLKDITLGTGAD
jgi:RNA polymerase sigma-32 factor